MNKKDFFNELAKKWDREFYNDSQRIRLKEIVNLMGIKEASILLEIGCGTGNLVYPLLEAVGQDGYVYAADIAEEMVNIAREKFKGVKNVTFELADASHLPYKDELFDYVICFGSFPHFDDKPQAIREIARVLVKRGRLFIAHAISSEEIKHHHSKCPPVANDQLPDKEEIQLILKKAGINIIRYIDEKGLYFCEGIKT